jgi:3-dehydro-scyllo-inosose hydrolase
LVQDEILAAFPSGTLPPIDKTTLRDPAELAPYLLEPMSPGWKSVYGLPLVGPR